MEFQRNNSTADWIYKTNSIFEYLTSTQPTDWDPDYTYKLSSTNPLRDLDPTVFEQDTYLPFLRVYYDTANIADLAEDDCQYCYSKCYFDAKEKQFKFKPGHKYYLVNKK